MTHLTMTDLVRDVGQSNRTLTDAEAAFYRIQLIETARDARDRPRRLRKQRQRRGYIFFSTIILILGFAGYGGYAFGAYKEKQRQKAQAYGDSMDFGVGTMYAAYGAHVRRLEFDDALANLHAVRHQIDANVFAEDQLMLLTTFIGELYDTSDERTQQLAEEQRRWADINLRGMTPEEADAVTAEPRQ